MTYHVFNKKPGVPLSHFAFEFSQSFDTLEKAKTAYLKLYEKNSCNPRCQFIYAYDNNGKFKYSYTYSGYNRKFYRYK